MNAFEIPIGDEQLPPPSEGELGQHSPLPWSEDQEGEVAYSIEDANGIVLCDVHLNTGGANSAFIVKAVNHHDELVAALSNLVDHSIPYLAEWEATEEEQRDFAAAQELLAKLEESK